LVRGLTKMPTARVRHCAKAKRDIDLCYEAFGSPTDVPVLLIMGLNGQLLYWDTDFCKQLAQRGYFVIRYDNRDVGLSTKLDHMGSPSVAGLVLLPNCCAPAPPYDLEDMATDAVMLLSALKIDKAHVIGHSMGGMIAQLVAAKFPDRVLSLTSSGSTTGKKRSGLKEPSLSIKLDLAKKPKNGSKEAFIEHQRWAAQKIFTPPEQFNAEFTDRLNADLYDRSTYQGGAMRHAAAVLRAEPRDALLRGIRCPALVLHGDKDLLVDISQGKHTADCIAHSTFVVLEGAGHSLVPPLFQKFIDSFEIYASKRLSAAGMPF